MKKIWIALVFGWLPLSLIQSDEITKSDVATDEGGNDWSNAYQLDSPHYTLKTDIPEAEARTCIRNMEIFHKTIFKEFEGVISEDRVKGKFGVYFYNDFATFRKAMGKAHPDKTNADGFYSTSDHWAHFFKIETKIRGAAVPDDETVYHECTHQVLDAARKGKGWNSMLPHFWSVEGIACLFESMSIKDGQGTLGQRQPSRFQLVRKHMAGVKGTKLSQYVQLNQQGMMKNGQVNYAVASALSYFLYTVDDGKYRKPFLEYAYKVNNGEVNKNLFQDTFGFEIDTLQDKFKQFLGKIK